MHFGRADWMGRLRRRGLIAGVIGWLALTGLLLAGRAVGQAAFADRPLLAFIAEHGADEVSISLADLQGGAVLQWRHLPRIGSHLMVSPDGRWLAFTRWIDERNDVYLIGWLDGAIHCLTGDMPAAHLYVLQWSPDSRWIAYRRRGEGRSDLYTVNVDTGENRRLSIPGEYVDEMTWSPDSSQVAYTVSSDAFEDRDIYVVDVDTGQQRLLVDDPADDNHPRWSPDGRWLAFISARTINREIYRIDLTTGRVDPLTHDSFLRDMPVWSPRGDQLAYTSVGRGGHGFFLLNMDSGEVSRLSRIVSNGPPTWSPDGRWLAYACTLNTSQTSDICLVDTYTGEVHDLPTPFVNHISPTWLP